MSMTSIGSILPEHLKNSKVGEQLEATAILDRFMQKAQEIWGKAIEKDMRPMYLKNKTLTIAVGNAALAQEMKLHEEKILSFLNDVNTDLVVERLRYLL